MMAKHEALDRRTTASLHAEEPPIYTTKIIKAGALLADTKTLLAHWDGSLPARENLERSRRENIFGKSSRSRVEDILAIFRQRYLTKPAIMRALIALVRNGFAAEGLDKILYFHTTQSDRLLHDTVIEVLAPLYAQGRTDVAPDDIRAMLNRWVDEGKTTGRWSNSTTRRVTQGLLATLRDFGVLLGATNKRIAPSLLPVRAFAHIAFCLRQRQPSGSRLIDDPEWRLFFIPREGVERFLVEADQLRLLEYHAAGSIVRISFPAESLEEYADVLAPRPH
jgi:hypothetical protein